MVSPISQSGHCLARCPLSSPAPRKRQESHTVTMLFTLLVLNAGSLRVEHQHILTSCSHSDNLREYNTHTQQSMGVRNPSPRVSVCRSGRQHRGQGSHQHLARKDLRSQVGSRAGEVLSPAGQSPQRPMPREMSVAWSSTLVHGAQQSQQWSGACLSYTLRVVCSTLLGLFDKCLGTPDTKWGLCPGVYLWVVPLCRHGCSDHVCRYLRCVSLPDMSILTTWADMFPCQMRLH